MMQPMTNERTDRSPRKGTQDRAPEGNRIPDARNAVSRIVESVCFRVAGRLMAIPIDQVAEAVELPPITPLFHLPRWVLGLAPLRGDILLVLDLAGLFDLTSNLDEESRVLVVRTQDRHWGVLVNEIVGVKRLERAETGARGTPGIPSWAEGLFFDGRDPVVVLDMNRLAQHVGENGPSNGEETARGANGD